MKLTQKQKQIIRQDIIDLKMIAKMYSEERKFAKASDCLKEAEQLQKKLGGETNE